MRSKSVCSFMIIILVFSAFSPVLLVSYNANSIEGTDFSGYNYAFEDAFFEGMDAELDLWHGEGFSANVREALNQLDFLYSSFARNRDGEFIYPDFYGGSYIGEDGSLVILIARSAYLNAYNHSTTRAILDTGVSYRLVDFSFAELRAAGNIIFDIAAERAFGDGSGCVYAYNVFATGISPDLNQVTVFLVELSDEMIAGFRKYVYDSPMLRFEQMDRFNFDGGTELYPFVIIIILICSSIIAAIIICKIKKTKLKAYTSVTLFKLV